MKFRVTVEPLTDELIEAARKYSNRIMVRPWWKRHDIGSIRHYRVYRDADGWYIRTAKRGQIKEYLDPVVTVTAFEGAETKLHEFTTGKERWDK